MEVCSSLDTLPDRRDGELKLQTWRYFERNQPSTYIATSDFSLDFGTKFGGSTYTRLDSYASIYGILFFVVERKVFL